MRLLLISVALLAGLKVWTQDRLYRAAVGETIVAAYRDRVAQACHKMPAKAQKASFNPWTAAPMAELVIGDAQANVAMWDFENPMWDVRFRHPHLVMTTSGAEPLSCAYDLTIGMASVRAR